MRCPSHPNEPLSGCQLCERERFQELHMKHLEDEPHRRIKTNGRKQYGKWSD